MRKLISPAASLAWNLLVVMLLFSACRFTFYFLNKGLYPGMETDWLMHLCKGGLRFDLSAVLYVNSLYVLAMLLPFSFRDNEVYRKVLKWVFVITNFLCLAMNLCDCVYFAYTNQRTSMSVFQEFEGDSQVSGIMLKEALRHWYLILEGLAMLAILIVLYKNPVKNGGRYTFGEFLGHTAVLAALLYPFVAGMRGGFGVTTRPIAPNDANVYVDKPIEAGIVLNTPFCFIRTADAKPYTDPHFMENPEEVFSPVHRPKATQMRKKNVVILIVESFSAAYSEYLGDLQGMPHPGYMPFLDSLMKESYMYRYSVANGRLSIDALPSVMLGIPAVTQHFTLCLYNQNKVRGLAEELGEEGYQSAFYHGAARSSLAIAGFAHRTGFQKEYSREDYNNEKDFDGTWGIWDMPFLQYFEKGISSLQEPFLAAVFTLSSHNPFKVPDGTSYPEGTIPMHKVVGYTDDALRKFFDAARLEPWYNNTLFVITGDHTGITDIPEYKTDTGRYLIPIVFYTPDGSLKGLQEGIAQQLDIKPTILGYLGYSKPYFSFGQNLLETSQENTCALNYPGSIQYYKDNWMLQFDGEKAIGLFRWQDDIFQADNLMEANPDVAARLELETKAQLQQLYSRMIHNQLTAD